MLESDSRFGLACVRAYTASCDADSREHKNRGGRVGPTILSSLVYALPVMTHPSAPGCILTQRRSNTGHQGILPGTSRTGDIMHVHNVETSCNLDV